MAILKNDSALPSTTITYHISSPHHASETLNPQLCDGKPSKGVFPGVSFFANRSQTKERAMYQLSRRKTMIHPLR